LKKNRSNVGVFVGPAITRVFVPRSKIPNEKGIFPKSLELAQRGEKER